MSRKKKDHGEEPDVSRLKAFSGKDSYKVPPGYFEAFPRHMMEKAEHFSAGSATSVSSPMGQIGSWLVSRPWTMASAAAALALLVTLAIVYERPEQPAVPQYTQVPATDTADGHEERGGEQISTRQEDSQQQDRQKEEEKPDRLQRTTPAWEETRKIAGKPSRQITLPESQGYDSLQNGPPPMALPTPDEDTSTQMQQGPGHHPDPGVPFMAQQESTSPGGESTPSATPRNGSQQKQPVASHGEQPIPKLFPVEDTCIHTPLTFHLPDLPNGYSARWESRGRSKTLRVSASGTYQALITNARGDTISIQELNVTYLPKPPAYLQRQYTACRGQNLKLDPGFYDENYRFQWSDGVESPVNFVSSSQPGEKQYALKITGCETYVYQTNVVFNPCELKIPNVITPNGSGANDHFVIEGIENYPGSRLILMDRNGNQVYSSHNYQNDFDGQNLPKGAYFYILVINDNNQTTRKGILNIYYE